MSAKAHHIRLSAGEYAALEKISASNHKSEREKKRARILLLCYFVDDGIKTTKTRF